MAWQTLIDRINQQAWLKPVEDKTQAAVHRAYDALGPARQPTLDALHGKWLGHPLHPALTDVPLGAWTAALAIDGVEMATDNHALAPGADAAIAIGLAGATGAALTGLTDWQHLSGRSRRVGIVHGGLNVLTVLLYLWALVLRRRGARRAGCGVAMLGFAAANSAAFLGGDLVYGEHIGVDRANDARPPRKFTRAMAADELPENELRRVDVGGARVLLVRQGDTIHALSEVCSHLGGPLAEGQLVDGCVVCPWHGSRFALDDGRVIDSPATFPQPCYEARVQDGQVEVRARRA